MKHYIDSDRLRAEIERHIKEVKEAGNRFHPNLGFFDAKLSGIYDTISIIDSLQQEQDMDGLEEEIEKVCAEIKEKNPQHHGLRPSGIAKIARHFAEWGAKHLKR